MTIATSQAWFLSCHINPFKTIARITDFQDRAENVGTQLSCAYQLDLAQGGFRTHLLQSLFLQE